MRISCSSKRIKDARGRVKDIIVRSFHCEVCNTFIHDENLFNKLPARNAFSIADAGGENEGE